MKDNTPIELFEPHTPERQDEFQRITASNSAHIFHMKGRLRVDGQLMVTRSIGDRKYKPHVTAKPETFSFDLTRADQLLILASDGLLEVKSV